jgi:hypothetical protein
MWSHTTLVTIDWWRSRHNVVGKPQQQHHDGGGFLTVDKTPFNCGMRSVGIWSEY